MATRSTAIRVIAYVIFITLAGILTLYAYRAWIGQ